ncbi:MAG: hypothetical protein E7L36_10115 [Prevotella bivia]|uniref:Uncharacterized protein n=1 Tax=Prevotella bivia DNF00320 TaxID=1401068 RepID=A0A096AG32_9BACT|nr:hypothetical protein [Prevotella bivia]EFB93141.1 hypothetical protein HMPREF0648_0006 [Prevotella bivia JCVIHMP010]KGF19858.1 hypothetical protein HMPREF1651_09575 [Prevotella bivia DNF00188]KGF45835.1 hypothetical protein HMPREF0647_00775 [Prevotella bivia DNF00320]MDU2328498.1 hypothetical protein [Prevotella bivia]MDU5343808.1 hypothetical protein [Prevotella bivia]
MGIVQNYIYLLIKKELVGDYNIKARELYDKGLISQAKYYQLLDDMGINRMQNDEKVCTD